MTTIYIRLLEEGTDGFRPTSAEQLGNGAFKVLPTLNYDPRDGRQYHSSLHEKRNYGSDNSIQICNRTLCLSYSVYFTMKIKCISNLGRDLPPGCLRPSWGLTREREFPLLVGKNYQVYALTVLFGSIWYYICDETYSHYPVWTPSPLFEIVDGRVSSFWQLGFHQGNNPDEISPVIAFKEWAEDPTFYDRLTDGQASEVETFRRYKRLLDEEYGDRIAS